MGGVLHGSIEHNISNTVQACLYDQWGALVQFFDSRFTRIASQAGSTPTGTRSLALPGYWDDANHISDNAFGVWRWDRVDGAKVYILAQCSYGPAIGDSPGNPGVCPQGTYGTGIQFALDTSGGNPWNGTSVNDGNDTKGTPVWVAAGGTLLVWPRANGPSGTYATNKEAMLLVGYYDSSGTRCQHLVDDDALIIAHDGNKTGGYERLMYFGSYTARSGVTLTTGASYVLFNGYQLETSEINWANDVGTTGGSSAYEGGIVVDPADGVRTLRIGSIYGVQSTSFQPNTATGAFDIMPIYLRANDTSPTNVQGLMGEIDPSILALVYNVSTHDTDSTLTRACFGATTAPVDHWLTRWDGVTTPGTGTLKTGIQF